MNAFARDLDSAWASAPRDRNERMVESASAKLSQVVKSMRVASDAEAVSTLDRHSPAEDWSRLIERVQTAARQAREADERSQRREEQAQSILFDARKRLDEAADRIHAAEQRADAAEAHAADAIAAAEERVRAAEEICRAAEERMHAAEAAAHTAETWLMRVQQTILAEFAEIPTPSSAAPQAGSVSHIAAGSRRVA